MVPRTGICIEPIRLQTRRGLKDWARQRILDNETEAKKRRLNGPTTQDGKEADGEYNRTAFGFMGEPERTHALSTGFFQIAQARKGCYCKNPHSQQEAT